MYNTGDLGAWREDGEIEMLGRVDDQIKIKVRQHTRSSLSTEAY